LTDSGLSKD